MKKILLGHRITIEPIYKSYFITGENDAVSIEPAMPRLEGHIYNLSDGVEVINKYFAAIPKT